MRNLHVVRQTRLFGHLTDGPCLAGPRVGSDRIDATASTLAASGDCGVRVQTVCRVGDHDYYMITKDFH